MGGGVRWRNHTCLCSHASWRLRKIEQLLRRRRKVEEGAEALAAVDPELKANGIRVALVVQQRGGRRRGTRREGSSCDHHQHKERDDRDAAALSHNSETQGEQSVGNRHGSFE